MDAGWHFGSLTTAHAAPEPEPEGADVSALLDEAENIVNSAAPEVIAELAAADAKGKKRFGKRKKKK